MRFVLISIILTTCACVSSPAPDPIRVANQTLPDLPLLDESYFTKPASIIPVEQVFHLTAKQKDDFLSQFNSNQYASYTPNQRVARYLKNHLNNFGYFANTFTASKTLAEEKGNCLSLAILTKSLADIADVKITYELVETDPVYQKEGDLILTSQHIRTRLFEPVVSDGAFFTRGYILIDYFPTRGTRRLRNVDEKEFFSMYYANKATDALVVDNNDLVFWNLKMALAINKNDGNAINMMALLHDRMGYPDYAEKLYLFGIEYSDRKIELLNNYEVLLRNLNRINEAETIAKQLVKYHNANPFKWISLANSAYNAKEYSAAIRFYKKASKMADYLHEPYAGMARAYQSKGDLASAQNLMKKALKKTQEKAILSVYQAKYDLLNQLISEDKN